MNMAARILLSANLVGLALAGCGGGPTAVPSDRTAAASVAVGEPDGGVPVVSEYIKMAQGASRADTRNRLFVIDGRYVLWDRAGQCADAAHAQTLMGPTPQAVLCSAGQSIAGPRTHCSDAGLRPLFVPREGRLEVLHLDAEPGPGAMCTMAITTPAHLVVVDRSSLPVVFSKKIHFIG